MGINSQHKLRFFALHLLGALILSFAGFDAHAQDLVRVKNLEGYWKFALGDDQKRADPDYDDSDWEEILVPGKWEDQGFHGYDGYAWYRTTIRADFPEKFIHSNLYLKLGYIDDVDQVFINGKKIGQTGQFPPDYATACNANRLYIIPHKVKQPNDELCIAVRVFDEGGEGGFIHGELAIVADMSSIVPDINLQGNWKFATGHCQNLPEKSSYDNWDEIIVPGTWEDQGYKNHDGKACYVLEFDVSPEDSSQRMILLLGKIDDLDMVFLNGTLIGQSGPFNRATFEKRNDIYKQNRAYFIPPGILQANKKNVLLVRIWDFTGLGGIWDGTVGLISQKNYIRYWRNKRRSLK